MRRRSFLLSMASMAALAGCQTMSATDHANEDFGTRPLLVTGESEDPLFNDPYVDVEEWRDTPMPAPNPLGATTQQTAEEFPVRHLYVHGGFRGTDLKFTISFPPPEKYQGRFYQPTHQLLTSEITQPRNVAMAVAAGAYIVQTNQGGSAIARTSEGALQAGYDSSIGSYRANAAAAKYSRIVAQRIYNRQHRPFGYLYGGSGGAYQTVASSMNTEGVWDGFIPFVMANPAVTTSQLLLRARALYVLRNKWPAVIDAFEPGGGDPYATLNAEERNALEEATLYGFPPRAWFNYVPAGTGPLGFVASYVPLRDPSYLTDFWTQPGYIVPPSTDRESRIQQEVTIVRVIERPTPPQFSQFMVATQLELSDVPNADLTNVDLIGVTGDGAGQSAPIGSINGKTISFALGARGDVVGRFKAGDTVRIDNSSYLALISYYRHALPAHGSVWDYPPVFDSFRNADGSGKYPQRAVNVTLQPAFGLDGVPPGSIKGKLMLMECLMDGDAQPWQAAWYTENVRRVLGPRYEDQYRVYYQDFAEHTPPLTQVKQTHVVSYSGALEQLLRDLSAWCEQGVAPPASTPHRVVRGQVEVPAEAAARKGVQPVVDLKVNGGVRADVRVGEPVTLVAKIDMPPGTGPVVAADWDFDGRGAYADAAQITSAPSVTVTATHAYTQPGTYFAAIRASSNRDGDADTPFARVQNLGRVRVVVT